MIKTILKQNCNKQLFITMAMLFILMILPGRVFAVALPPALQPSGSGTENDPYIVSTGSNLVWMSKNNNSMDGFAFKYFTQTADITISGQLPPIGEDDNHPFYGNYDGKEHTITCNTENTISKNSSGENSGFLGLFGDNAGVIKNLSLVENINGIVENIGGLAGENDGSIINCDVKGKVKSSIIYENVNESGYSKVINQGELVGYNSDEGKIISCRASGSVNATQTFMYPTTETYFGGLVGKNQGQITDSSTKGVLNSSGAGYGGGQHFYAGGLAGSSYGGEITNCYSTVKLTENNNNSYYNSGGLVCKNSGKISNCYATGDVNGGDAGGLVADNFGGTIIDSYATGNITANCGPSDIGGLVGYNSGAINNCFATGTVEKISNPSFDTGGLVGENSGTSTVENCYFVDNSGTNGIGRNDGTITNCIQKADLSFYKTLTTYTTSTNWDSSAPWDFTKTWLINSANNEYPQLISSCAKASGIKLDQTAVTLVRGQTGTLKVAFIPDNVYKTQLIWKSSNDSIVTVKNNNDLTAAYTANSNTPGNAIITATTVDGGFSATCNITVVNPTVITPVSSAAEGNINIGTKVQLTSQTSNADLYYTLDGTTPTKNSLKYTGPITVNGSLTLKIIGVCDKMNDSEVLTVNYTVVVGVTKIAFDKPAISLVKDTTIKPTFVISPGNAFNQKVTYLSSDTDIITVDADGVVTGKKMGNATLTVKTDDGGLTDVCTISVVPKSISTTDEFLKIGVDPDYLNSYSYILLNDIDLSGCDTSYSRRPFTGTFDGGGHTISNIKSNLFDSNTGLITKLKVNGNIIVNDESVSEQGVIANTNDNSGSISNCSSATQITFSRLGHSTSSIKGNQRICIGGIVGRGGNVINCDNNGSIKVFDNNNSDWCHIGGIVGSCEKNITDCTNNGDITFNDSSTKAAGMLVTVVGGIAGECDGYGSDPIIERCCNFGNLNTTVNTYQGLVMDNTGSGSQAQSYVGGICGSGGVISNSFNCGEIKSEAHFEAGGYRKYPEWFYRRPYAGGICGVNGSASNCYNIGKVSANFEDNESNFFKEIGIADNAINSYCLDGAAADASSAIIKTSAELKSQSTYPGFDFEKVWCIDPGINNGYPYLSPVPATETLTVSKPGIKGFTVTLSPALPGLKASDFTLLDSSNKPITITGATTTDSGTTYMINAALNAGQTYTVSATKNGCVFGTAQNVVVPPVSVSITGLCVSNSKSDELNLIWNELDEATNYNIYRSVTETGTYTIVGTSNTTSYCDKNLTADTSYYYKVSAVNDSGEGQQSGAITGYTEKIHYAVNIAVVTGGSITSSTTSAEYGETINLTVTPYSGMQLKAGTLKYNDGTKDYQISGTSFTMPDSNITVTAQFDKIPGFVSPESDFGFDNGVITGYNGPGGNVVIPSAIGGVNVTAIGVDAFCGWSSITSVTIPNSVTAIEMLAFEICSGLTSVTIPTSVTSIGEAAFMGCPITSAYFEGNAPILGYNAFDNIEGFEIYYHPGAVGFTNPWNDYQTATYETKYTIPLISIALNKTTSILFIGNTEDLTVSYDPENTTDDKIVSWKSSEPAIASVDVSGKVTALSVGKTTIKATVGSHTETCEVIILAILLGDVDANGQVQAYDALLALKIATGNKIGTSEEIQAADVGKSGNVEAFDALRILQYATGRIIEF